MIRKMVIAASIVALFAGCLKDKNGNGNVTTCTYDTCANAAPAAEIAALKDSLQVRNITATQHCSGVFYSIDSVGSGKTPTPCSYIAITYKGALLNGKVFDQQTTPVAFNLGTLILGWRNTLPLLKEGGSMRLYIPPSLGYGNKDMTDNLGNVVIPANSILVFDIRLLGVQ